MYALHLMAQYQEDRIRAWVSGSGEANYLTGLLRENFKNSSLLGTASNSSVGVLPDLNRDYIFSYILNTYGTIIGILTVLVLATFIIFIFSVVIKQKTSWDYPLATDAE